ncbi:hypothetical protein [Virgibacillus halodenitrificans]|uniref:hypothetical protein n=1 Tax=Virgibacillus halodenitrificans TaxID=1482 RepID=UPI001F24C5C3|nr:hypothetical protein [Virgibacillus halodenitrificans]
MLKRRKRKLQLSFHAITYLIIFIFSLSIYPTTSDACSCLEPGPPKEELKHSSAVFSGKVIKQIDENENNLIQSSADQIVTVLKVDMTWKGINETEVIVYTERDSASCGFEFKVNNSYLVYVTEKDDELHVSVCSRTTALSGAAQELAELGDGKKPTNQVSVNVNDESNESTNLGFFIYLAIMILLLGGGYRMVLKRRRN